MIAPHFVIGDPARPYLLRWYLTPWSRWWRTIPWERLAWWQRMLRSLPNVYLHKILRSDDDRALHDHPWANVSIVLAGGYTEVLPWAQRQAGLDDHLGRTYRQHRAPRSIVRRRATDRHRLEVYGPCWSLFITGRKVREWGFYCRHGWVHWRQFVAENHGQIGRGCEAESSPTPEGAHT